MYGFGTAYRFTRDPRFLATLDRIEQDANLIKQQTLIIWGEEDTVIPIKDGYKLNEEILNSRFVVLRNCGHVPPEEKPEIFTELVTRMPDLQLDGDVEMLRSNFVGGIKHMPVRWDRPA